MSQSRVERLVSEINEELTFWTNSYGVKLSVGDSVNNNRVLSIRQAIRFLADNNVGGLLSRDLDQVYTILRQKNLFKKLRRNNNRTDAYDLSELNAVVNKYVANDSSLKSTLGRVIKSVA